MKTKRNLSGMFVRSLNNKTNKWDDVCFEDLENDQMDEYLEKCTPEFIKGITKLMANTLFEIGEELGLVKE